MGGAQDSKNTPVAFTERATFTPTAPVRQVQTRVSYITPTRGSTPVVSVRNTPTPTYKEVVFDVDVICFPNARQNDAVALQRLALEFADVVQVANSTMRIQLAPLVREMQSIYRETWALTTTLCGEVVQQQTMTAMETIIAGFTLFMQGTEYEASATNKILEGIDQYEVAAERLKSLLNNPSLLLTPTPTSRASGPSASANANLRAGPGTNYDVVGGVAAGDALDIIGRNEAGDWYKLTDGSWIAAFLVDNAPVGESIVD